MRISDWSSDVCSSDLKAVRERTRDTWGLWRNKILNPESNVQFGEGGAGTFSDGKLYSQIRDPRHHGRKVLDEFVKARSEERRVGKECVSKCGSRGSAAH